MNTRKSYRSPLDYIAVLLLFAIVIMVGYLVFIGRGETLSQASGTSDQRMISVEAPAVNVNIDTQVLAERIAKIEGSISMLSNDIGKFNTTAIQFGFVTWEIEQLDRRLQGVTNKLKEARLIPVSKRSKKYPEAVKQYEDLELAYRNEINAKIKILTKIVIELENRQSQKSASKAPVSQKAPATKSPASLPAKPQLVKPRNANSPQAKDR